MERRDFLKVGAGVGAGAAAAIAGTAALGGLTDLAAEGAVTPAHTASYRFSVCRWPFGGLTVDQLAAAAKRLDLQSVELLEPEEWATARAHGLACAVGYAHAGDPKTRLTVGWNRRENHQWLLEGYQKALPLAAAAQVPNVICFSGNRAGLSDQQGIENCAAGLRQLMPDAERHGVTIVMELLNSKVDHPDHQCDHTKWGAALVDRVGSDRFKLLYDIYHMQIMEGDVIRTVRDYRQHIAHFHTAGVPGRHEIDGSQELYYPAVMRAIAETGFGGYVAQEFIPTRDPLTSLAEAVRLCRV